MKKTTVLITLILLIQVGVYSQTMEVGLFGGGSYYLGDINPGLHFQQTKPAAGIIARYNLDTRWSVRLSALMGKVGGSDEISGKVLDRNLAFESSITEIASVVEFNFYPYVNGSARNYFTPYIFGGASLFLFNPKFNDEKLVDYATEGQADPYLLHGLAIPFGIGLKYSVSQSIGLGFEWGMRKTFTDYIDDISTDYYLSYNIPNSNNTFNPNILEHRLSDPKLVDDPTFKRSAGSQRGNPKTMDWFNFVGISITVEFDIFDRSTCVDFDNGYRK